MDELRPYQTELKNKLYAALETHRSVLVQCPTGGGKCLGKGTPVLMADGSILPVQDIKVGDQIMGDDSTPRNVLSVTTGRENLYRITPTKGEPWVCNESHILSLVSTATDCGFIKGQVYDIELRDYLLLSKSQKHILKQYRAAVDSFSNNPEQPPLDPYFLGVLIGDGSLKRGVCVTTPDKEIVDELYKQADLFNLSVRHETMYNNANEITNIVKSLGANVICDNKFIPDCYKKGTVQTRLQILAGLLDTDGYLNHNFEFVSKSNTLANDVMFVARSLGFAAYITEKIVNDVMYYRLSISGDVHKIPTRIKRKQAEPRKQIKSVLRTGFTVTAIGEGEYYGFEIDGNRRFLLGDFTVTHNTVIFTSIIQDLVNQGKRGLLLVHRRELIRQAEQKIFKTGINYGHIMSGVDAYYSRPMQLASVQTLVRRNMPKKIDFIIVDECHHSVSSSYRSILNEYPEAKVIGFTATPCRSDGSGFEDIFETLITGPSVKFLIENGFLVAPKIYSVPLREDLSKLKTVAGDYRSSDIEAIMDRDVINGDIIESYKKHALNKKCVVFATTVKHSLHIVERYNEAGIPAVHIDGETPTEVRDSALRKFAKGDYLILSNVEIVTEGFDVPAIECVQLVRPTQSLSLYLQMVGRGLRSANGKERCIILDHANNVFTHLAPQHDREWKLTGIKKNKRTKSEEPVLQAGDIIVKAKDETGKLFNLNEIPREITSIELVEIEYTLDNERRDYLLRELRIAKKRKLKPLFAFINLTKKYGKPTVDEIHLMQKAAGYKSGWIRHQLEEHGYAEKRMPPQPPKPPMPPQQYNNVQQGKKPTTIAHTWSF